jgi:cell wall assembly regulator SMI1
MSIDLPWADLEDWLSKNCQELDGALRPAASPNKIDAVERHLGVTLPAAVKNFYLCHDGQTEDSPELFDGFRFLTLDEMVSAWSTWQSDEEPESCEWESAPDNKVKPVVWNRRWIPFASNGCGDYHCIDLDPDPDGNHGQIIGVWLNPPDRNLLSPSLGEWFQNFVTRVLNDEFHYCEDMNGFVEIEEDD